MTDKELLKKFNGKKVIEPDDNLLNIGSLTATLNSHFNIAFNIIRSPNGIKTLTLVLSLNGRDINRFTLTPQGARRLRDCLIEHL